MLKHPIYMAWGLVLAGWTGWVQYTGKAFGSVDEVRNVPRSVRDNPGSYRSHYSHMPRYYGGK